MTLRRLITLLGGIDDRAVQGLPQGEQVALARECLRLLKAAGLAPPQPKGGVLKCLKEGERSP
jgi:hypothetical protein